MMSLRSPMNQCLLKVPTFHPLFKFNRTNTHNNTLSFTINCNLKSKGKNNNLLSQKIVLSESSPPPLTQDNDDINSGNVPASSKNQKGPYGVVKKLSKKVLQILSNLPLAIGEMFTIAFLMGLGMCLNFSSLLYFFSMNYY